jgi:hypothetical protein
MEQELSSVVEVAQLVKKFSFNSPSFIYYYYYYYYYYYIIIIIIIIIIVLVL